MATKQSMYQMKYDNTHRRVYGFRLHNEIDKDIIDKLASVPNMQGYIKSLIRNDIARTSCESVPVSDHVYSLLAEEAEKDGKTIEDITNLIIDDYFIRNA